MKFSPAQEIIIPLERLNSEDIKRLVIERQRLGPDYKVRSMSGPLMSRDNVVESIQNNEPFGRVTVEAECSHLRDLLLQIEDAMVKRK